MRINTHTLKRMVGDLLDLSSIKTNMHPFKMIDIKEVIQVVFQSRQSLLSERGIKTEIKGKLPSIYGDPKRKRVVFSNLIDNAIKYMDQAKDPKIEVAYRENDSFHEFSISDTGAGISEGDCKNIFKPMWRHPDKKSDGSGLGLYFIKKIM